MARYTVHVPANADALQHEAALERAIFVRDGWSWAAFAFGPFWLLWNRHWITGVLTLVVMGALLAGLAALPASESAKAGAALLVMLLWGLEGSSLRRLALVRAGYAEEGLVVGDSLDALEQRFFAEMAENTRASAQEAPAATLPPVSGPGATPFRGAPVIGLFPDSRKPS
jgi:hypothetical protein